MKKKREHDKKALGESEKRDEKKSGRDKFTNRLEKFRVIRGNGNNDAD